MPRASKEQNRIDEQNVMKLLLRNPTADVIAIAEECNLSTQQVYKILRELDDKKATTGNYLFVDPEAVGMKRYIIFAKRSGMIYNERSLTSALYEKEMIDDLEKEGIRVIPEDDYTCSGEFDMVTVFFAESSIQANKYADYLRRVSEGNFSKLSVMEVMFTTKKNTKPVSSDIEGFIDFVRR